MGRPVARLSQQQCKALFDMYVAGASSSECGKAFHISNVTALSIIKDISPSAVRPWGGHKQKALQKISSARQASILIKRQVTPSAPILHESTFIRPPSIARLMAGR